jgi:endonuclease IV
MKRIINHPKLKQAAFILETPKKTDSDDKKNLAVARRMIRQK